jgi:flagellar protein FlaG
MAIEMISGKPPEYQIGAKGKQAAKESSAETPGIEREIFEDKVYLNRAIGKLKDAGDIFKRRLDFKIDEATNRIMIKVIDTETNKVVKEIPPEQLVRLAAKIQEMVGLLVDEER